MLRGIAGFGPRHQLRSDQSLSMSEDLSGRDRRGRHRRQDHRAGRAGRRDDTRGLITLERARLIGGSARAGCRRPRSSRLRRPPGAGVRTPAYRRGVRAAAPPRIRRCRSVSRRRRHGPRAAPPGPVLRPQRRRPGDDHRGRRRRAGRPTCCRSWRACCTAAVDGRAGAAVQARRPTAGPAGCAARRPTTTGGRCGRS